MHGLGSASPVQHLMRDLVDSTQFYYELADHPKEVQQLVEDLTPFYDQLVHVLAGSPAEAVMMAVRLTGRSSVAVARSVHPEYREVLETYAFHQGMPLATVPFTESGRVDVAELENAITSDAACFVSGHWISHVRADNGFSRSGFVAQQISGGAADVDSSVHDNRRS